MPETLLESPHRGRPMLFEAKADQPVTFLVTLEQKAALGQMSKVERRPVSAIVREAVDSYIGDYGEAKLFVIRGKYSPE